MFYQDKILASFIFPWLLTLFYPRFSHLLCSRLLLWVFSNNTSHTGSLMLKVDPILQICHSTSFKLILSLHFSLSLSRLLLWSATICNKQINHIFLHVKYSHWQTLLVDLCEVIDKHESPCCSEAFPVDNARSFYC